MARIFLLDGTALAYRAHFALARSGLARADGQPTGATYGFTMTLRRILEESRLARRALADEVPGRGVRARKPPRPPRRSPLEREASVAR